MLLARGVEVVGAPTLVGREQQHLRLTFRQDDMLLRGIGFAMGERLAQAKTGVLDIVFTPPTPRVERARGTPVRPARPRAPYWLTSLHG